MIKWFQTNIIARVILLIARLYLGYGWLMSGLHKFTDGFDASGFLHKVIESPVMSMSGTAQYPNFVAFLEHFVLPQAGLINFLIPFAEVTIGIMLIIGLFTPIAALIGVCMNFLFLFAGAVTVNPLYILLGLIIFISGFNAGRWGVDFFARHAFDNPFFRFFNYTRESLDGVNHR